MNCSEFVRGFTDYFDGVSSREEVEAIEGHLTACPTCGRYRSVYERGTALLRTLPSPELPDDFRPRLQHRLYHEADARGLLAHTSGTPALTVFGLAILLTIVAWAPVLFATAPVVELAPIVVDRAPTAVRTAVLPPEDASRSSVDPLRESLWEQARLYEYSSLSERYGRSASTRR